MIIISCSHGLHLAKKIAAKLKKPYSPLEVTHFPDTEIKLKFNINVKNKIIVLIQSFYRDINDCIIETLFAAETAKDLGAKKVILVAPYFPYLRQDKRFNPGECVSLRTIAKNIDEDIDEIYIIDPHLHREKTLSHIFKIKSHKLTANSLIENYIKKTVKNPVIIGPDWESYKWAQRVAEKVGCDFAIMEKERYSARKVSVKLNKKIDIRSKNLIFIDDMISTGHTLLEAIKAMKKLGGKKVTCFAVHGILVENALEKLQKAGATVITSNTIPNKAAKIDVSEIISNSLL
ncbi:MAG: ribose-phosphate diphosphokinase [Nanoarchaeota archaeon]|nr:ribose-phosphate diphosphokinase [Nanoarchaeota archaeon]MBU1945416.1 ribose-phosphate diphosphokinase [Nanoarchaeota archaeon]